MNKLWLITIAIVLMAGIVSAGGDIQPTCHKWDKSSLIFHDINGNCEEIYATFCNGEIGSNNAPMTGQTWYEVYYIESGNPKNGVVVDSGVFGPLGTEECETLTHNQAEAGVYKFKAYQRPGHPGTGHVWSDSIDVEALCPNDVPEFGVIAGAAVLIGTAGFVLYRRR